MTSKLEDWELLTLRERLTPKTVDLKFLESNKKPESGSYELKSGIIKIVAADSFSGEDDENPYKHLEKLKQVCHTFHQDGVLLEWVKWNLFPFTLVDKANKWYQAASIEAKGDWEILEQKFISRFVSPLKVHKLRKAIWAFEQRWNEDIDEAWERLDNMLTQGPLLGVTPDMHIQVFYYSLTSKAFEKVNTTAGGSLMSRTWSEANKILSDIRMACNSNRERKDNKVKEPEEEYMRPHLPFLRTSHLSKRL